MSSNQIYETFGCTSRPSPVSAVAFGLNTWGVYTVTKANGGNLIRYANNSQLSSVAANQGWHTTFRLGTGNLGGGIGSTSSFQGQIAEMAVWDKILSTQDRSDVFDYFNDKFALGL
jgi:hypothetical protein